MKIDIQAEIESQALFERFLAHIEKICVEFPFLSEVTLRVQVPNVETFDPYTNDWTPGTAAEYFHNGNLLIVHAAVFSDSYHLTHSMFNDVARQDHILFLATHEMGHALDHYLSDHSDPCYRKFRKFSDEFIKGFPEFSQYSCLTSEECFAEMFTALYLDARFFNHPRVQTFAGEISGMTARLINT